MRNTPKEIKGRMPLLVGALAIVLALMWMLGRCSRQRASDFAEMPDARPAGDTIVVAIEMSPMLYTRNADSITGLDYEIIRNVAAKHGLPVKFRPFVPLHYALDGLERGDYDVVVAALPATSETRSKYLMTDAVYTGRQVLVQRRDSASGKPHITSQEQLAGHKVWVVEDSPYKSRLANLGAELGDTIYVHTTGDYSAEHLCMLTASGEIPRAVVDEATARRIASHYDRLDISVPVSFNQFQSWAVGRESLRDSFNLWLDEFRRTSAYDSLITSYGLK
ncbi:MAG: transporter substrate-binding domain-containing protein [Muribaculaceae bacterium]|nr:transporter substrate-binding domain-containing protein [Muribaculaceae bacterium]